MSYNSYMIGDGSDGTWKFERDGTGLVLYVKNGGTWEAVETFLSPTGAPVIISPAPPNPSYGVKYAHRFISSSAQMCTWSISSGSLPAWATLDQSTGVLSGIPGASESRTFTVRATNATGYAEQAATVTVTYASKMLFYSPVAYWKLDETSGTNAADSSGNGRNGTYNGVTLNATTAPDGSPAGVLDGINDGIQITNDLTFSGASDYTIVFWAKATSTDSIRLAYDLGSFANRSYMGIIAPNWVGCANNIEINWSGVDNNWHFFAQRRASGVAVARMDSTTRNIATGTSSLNLTANAQIGRRASAAQFYWGGSVAHFAIFNSALADAVLDILATP